MIYYSSSIDFTTSTWRATSGLELHDGSKHKGLGEGFSINSICDYPFFRKRILRGTSIQGKKQRTVWLTEAKQSFVVKSNSASGNGVNETYLLSAELLDKSGSFSRLAR